MSPSTWHHSPEAPPEHFCEDCDGQRRMASAVVKAYDAYIEAIAGRGHEGPHDQLICPGFHDMTHGERDDCSACGGAQYGTEGEQVILFDIINRRYQDQMPMILLTNQSKEGFKQYLGDRAFDRLREAGRWVAFDWESHRGRS